MRLLNHTFFYCVSSKLRAWEEQQACWESQKTELEQRVEDGEDKADKLEKYEFNRLNTEVHTRLMCTYM